MTQHELVTFSEQQQHQVGLDFISATIPWDRSIAVGWMPDEAGYAPIEGALIYKSSRTTSRTHTNPYHIVPIENVLMRHEEVEKRLKDSLGRIEGGITAAGDIEEGDIALLGDLMLRWRLGALVATDEIDVQQSFADMANRRTFATYPDNIAIWGTAARLQRLTGQAEPEPHAFDRESELLQEQLQRQGRRIRKQLALEVSRARVTRQWLQAENNSQLTVATKAVALSQMSEVSDEARNDFIASTTWPRFRRKHLKRLAHEFKAHPDAQADPRSYAIVTHGYLLSRLHGAILQPLRPLPGAETIAIAERERAAIASNRDRLQTIRAGVHPAFHALIDRLVETTHEIIEATDVGNLDAVRTKSNIAKQLVIFYGLPSEQGSAEFARWHGSRL